MILVAILVAALVAAAFAYPLGRQLHPYGGWVLAAVPAALFLAIVVAGHALSGDAAITETVRWLPSLGIEATFRLDGFSRLFALLITGIGTLVVIYAGAYFADAPARTSARFMALILFFMGAMLGTVLADDLVVMFVFWEATGLASFMLIGFDQEKPAARSAALQSLLVTAGGGLALFAGILLIGQELGTYRLSEVAARGAELVEGPSATAIMVLILIGAFAKSAQVPFHFWLPNAMEAPTPASAYLHSATMVKLGVYLLARFDQVFETMPAFGTTLVVFGSVTMIVASARALSRSGYKAILAQSTVASLGLLVLLIGVDGPAATTGMLGFLLAHALYKAPLFFCAGTAIHATGRKGLTEINGLANALPMTAFAALLAAVSMAGLPPTLGFIAKEYLLGGQLDSTSGAVVVAITVLTSAVFVAIALIVSLRPFYLGRVRAAANRHGETPGLFIPPLLLGALGILFGLLPGLLAVPILEPATGALLGRPAELSFSLWHGLTPMLALSAVAIALGVVLYVLWPRLLAVLSDVVALDTVFGDAGYKAAMSGIRGLARRTTGWFLDGDQRRYMAITLLAILAMVVIGLVRTDAPMALDFGSGTFHLASTIVLVLMTIGAIAATRTTSLLTATIAAGIVGFGSALLFLMNGAPDLALTQFSVEVLVVVILMALLLRLPMRAASTRSRSERRIDIALGAGVAIVIFVALTTMVTTPLDLTLTAYFNETSYTIAHGRNVVNVILVDYRGLDTMGEISVISFAALAIWGLLRRRVRVSRTSGSARP